MPRIELKLGLMISGIVILVTTSIAAILIFRSHHLSGLDGFIGVGLCIMAAVAACFMILQSIFPGLLDGPPPIPLPSGNPRVRDTLEPPFGE